MPRRGQPTAGRAPVTEHGERRRTAVIAVTLLQCAAVLAFFTLDDTTSRAIVLIASASLPVLVVAVSTWCRPPARALVWWVLAAGQVCSVVGWCIWYLTPFGDTTAGDAAFLLGYGTSAVALLGLGGLRRREDRVAALDAAMLTVGLGVLGWVLVVAPVAGAAGTSTAERVIATAYPLVDVLLVAVTVRLVFAARDARSWLLLCWAGATGAADTVYALASIDGTFAFGTPVFAFWMAGYAALGAAALMPHDVPVVERSRRQELTGRLVLIAAVVPLPVLLAVRAAQGSTQDVPLIAVGSVLLTALAVVRGVLVANAGRGSVARAALRGAVLRSTTGFVVLALLPIAGLAYVAVQESSSAMQSEVHDRLAVTAAASADYVGEQLDGIGTLVTSYATRPSLVSTLEQPEPDVAALDRHMAGLQAAHPDLFGAWVLDADGVLTSFRPETPSVVGRSFAGRDYFTGALSASGPYVSEAFVAAAPDSPRAVGVAVAVRDSSGRVLGVVTVGYRLDGIRTFTERLADVQHVTLTISDQRAQVLAGVGSSDDLQPSQDELVGRSIAGEQGTVDVRGEDGRRLASYAPVPALGWGIVAETSRDAALAGADRLAARVVAAALLLSQFLLAGLVLVVRSEIRRRTVEEALAERKEHLHGVLEAAGDAYVSIDADGRVTAWNARAAEVFGQQADDVLGGDFADLVLPEPVRALHRAGVARVLSGGEPRMLGQRVEIEAAHADGRVFPAEITLWQSGSCETPSFNAFVRDVTVDRAQAAELAAAHDAALEASRLKSEFVANMSHEIRTPMNGVLGMTALLQDTDLDAVQRDYVDTVSSCAESLLTVIDDILDFSKIEAGKLEIEAVDFELRPLVEDVVGLLGAAASSRGLEIVAWIDPGLRTHVHGDPHRLRQVLNNLVGNAVKYTERGEVVVHAELSPVDGHSARLSVRDTGIGLTPAQQARLFDAFEQADASTTRKYGGTGLGLTISRQLVELMGGRIDVVSTPGVGSTFFFDLPLPAAVGPVRERPRRRSMDGVRALLVDDNATNRKVLNQYLTAWGVAPTCVADAASALSELRLAQRSGAPYDVVVLDMHMPGTDGLQLAQAVRTDPALSSTPMAMLTSTNQRGERAAAKAAGVGAYLTKPVRQDQLFDRLGELLGDTEVVPARVPQQRAQEPAPSGRVLVAEDNLVNQKVVTAMLEQLGYVVEVAGDGRQAVERVQTAHFDAVLMDCQMPVLDGFGAARAIRALDGPVARTPIIALTASALPADEQRCREAGMDAFLSKPLRRETLAQAVLRWTAVDPRPAGDPLGTADDGLDHGMLDELSLLGQPFADAVTAYLETTPLRLDELEAAVRDGDVPAMGRLVHVLAGSSGAVAVGRLSATCQALEVALGDGSLPSPADVARLRAEHEHAARALAVRP